MALIDSILYAATLTTYITIHFPVAKIKLYFFLVVKSNKIFIDRVKGEARMLALQRVGGWLPRFDADEPKGMIRPEDSGRPSTLKTARRHVPTQMVASSPSHCRHCRPALGDHLRRRSKKCLWMMVNGKWHEIRR
jgi:hypothetical protein